MKKEPREIARKLEKQGWRIDYQRTHAMAYPPDRTKRAIPIPNSPSDHRWRKNLIAMLRRAGADV
jgi:hypothetical protein